MQEQKKNEQCSNINSFPRVHERVGVKNRPRFGGDEIRVVDSMIDIIYPPVPFPSNKIFKAIGEEKIRKMVEHHHELLLKTKLEKLFPPHEEALKMVIDKSADFFVEALGGGDTFTSQHGEPRLRMRHFKIPIDESDREIWLAMYKKTMKDIEFPKEHYREFWEWIEALSIRMINRRTNMDAIKRHHWHDVKEDFKIKECSK